MKVIVAGTRTFNNYQLLKETLDNLDIEITEIVCGEAPGADRLGKFYAQQYHIPIASFPADWSTYKHSAGPRRNQQMAEYGDYLVAFWNGKSPGTRDMIHRMEQIGKHGKVVRYD